MNQQVLRKLKLTIILIRIIFGGLLFGILSFLSVTTLLLVTPGETQVPNDQMEIFQLTSSIFMVVTVSVSIFLRKSMLAKVHNETNPLKLLQSYTSSRIVQLALLDGSILFAIVCYLLTSNLFFVLLCGIGILYFASLFPIRNKVIQQLKLDSQIGY